MLQRRVDFGIAGGIQLITPARLVVCLLLLVPTGEEAFLESEPFLDEERRVGMQRYVFTLIGIMGQRVVDQTAEKRDIRSGADRDV